jgi:outer membrane lipoprotein-sorting protein
MKRLTFGIACTFIFFAWAAATRAYILPAEQILNFLIDGLGPGRTLIVTQKTVHYDPGFEGGIQEYEETLYYGFPDRFRSEVTAPGLEQVRVVNPDGAILVMNGRIVAETENGFDHFKDLLLYRQTGLLVDRLSQSGVNLQVVSLGRFNDKIVYVIGAKYPDESVPQVWIDKTTFRPARFLLPDGGSEGDSLQDIQFTDYTSLDKGKTYPGRILFLENDTLVKMQVLETFSVDAEVPGELFDVAYLRDAYEPLAPIQPLPPPASEPEEVKKSIEEFKKIFE